MILLIDNYDSFVHNLARYFRRLGCETLTVRNDAVSLDDIAQLAPQAIVISPGPGSPQEAGISVDLVRNFYARIPILGVCLGHQAIATAFGANVVRAREPMHGRTSAVTHQETPLFNRIASPFDVCRYHSLIVDPTSLPDELVVTAQSVDGTVMAMEHIEFPLAGVQFHPEAILTHDGYRLLANFLGVAEIPFDESLDQLSASEYCFAESKVSPLPVTPVTF